MRCVVKSTLFILLLSYSNILASEEWNPIPVKNGINIHDLEFYDYANCGLVDEEDDSDEWSCSELDEFLTKEEQKPNVVQAICRTTSLDDGYYCRERNLNKETKETLADILRQSGMKQVNFAVPIECTGVRRYSRCTWVIFGEK